MTKQTKKNKKAEELPEPNPVGRPRKYKTPEELQAKIDEYFETSKKFAVGKLGYFLGFEDRQSLKDYIDRKDEFSCIVRKAKYFIEGEYELLLQENNVTGIIFALKNMGWKDKQDIHQVIEERLDLIELDNDELEILIAKHENNTK